MEGNISEPTVKSLEGKIVTARGLKAYARFLHFNPDLLRDQSVLNFGSGGSNIGKELARKKISSRVVDVDLQVTGVGKFLWGLKTVGNFLGIDEKSKLGKKMSSMHAKSAYREGRNFVQADGRSLPFEDKSFDTVLALASTQQVQDGDRELVFRELMRVGNAIHCGPISQSDFRVLKSLSEEKNFDVIGCFPYGSGDFIANSPKDYQEYRGKYPAEQRIKPYAKESLSSFKALVGSLIDDGTYYIVLQRRP